MNFKGITLIILFFLSRNVEAQTCCSGGIPLSNNIGLSFKNEKNAIVSLSYDFNNLNTLKSNNETIDDDSRLRTSHSVLVNLGYSFTNRLSFETLFTWINQRRLISQFDNESLDSTSGIGDAVILGRYTITNPENSIWNVNLGLGLKVPLGSSTETSNQGVTLNADLQPGSNAWDIIYLLSASRALNFRPSMNIGARIIYRQTGENPSYLENSTYKFGNVIQSYLSIADQFIIQKTLLTSGLTFKYRYAEKDQIQDIDLPNTGGQWVFLIPNISVNLDQNISLNVAAELPIYAEPDGVQLTPTYRITSGIIITLFNRSQKIILN